MNYPLISEYVEAIKSAEDNFDELSYLRPVLGDNGLPIMSNGNFAVVFKMKDERDGKLYAVKCFTKEQEGRAESYKLIADELEFVSSNYLTPIKFLEKELFVDTEQTTETEFPILLMDWVEGKTLDVYIKENINNQYALEMLAYQFNKMAAWLLTQPFAHGDLKPDNIFIKDNGILVLVDYDGMFVPAMKGYKARENGSPGYCHPSRNTDEFDEHIDDFPIASIALSLKAIALDPSLYAKYGGNDRLLFTEKDFQDISSSKFMSSLQLLMHDSEFCTLYGVFLIALAKNDLSSISYKLLLIDKSQKENVQQMVSLYLKGKKCVKEGKYETAYHIFSDLAANEQWKGVDTKWTKNLCGKVLGENGLAFMYAYGLIVPQDYHKTLSLYKSAAENGFSMAQFNLGLCYEKGYGVEEDKEKAKYYYHLAASQNFGPARNLESWDDDFVSSNEDLLKWNLERWNKIKAFLFI